MGFEYKKAKQKPILSDKQKEIRLNWAKDHEKTDWKNIIFSDETSIWTGFNGRKRWVNTNIDDVDRTTKYTTKRHVWGCINPSFGFVGFIFSGIMNSKIYVDILKKTYCRLLNGKKIF